MLLVLAVLVGLGVAFGLLVRSRRGALDDRMRSELAIDVEEGGLQGLVRAQARARHLLIADAGDREAVATLAFTSAALAVEYGLEAGGEVQTLLARYRDASGTSDEVAGLVAAARALLLLGRGDRDRAVRVAMTAAQAMPGAPHPLYALGRIRARAGDLAGAVHALEAAIVRTPGFTLAEVTLAEARLDSGDAQAARAALLPVLARSGDDAQAMLLLEEAERALGVGGAPRAPCDKVKSAHQDLGSDRSDVRTAWRPLAAAVRAGCELAEAARARVEGRRSEALGHAEAAGRLVPAEPRLLARTALLLAQLGPVDFAAGLLERARRLAAPQAPALAWAEVAVELGRGKTPALPPGPRPADPETALVVARAALSAAGVGAMRSALASLPRAARDHDADLAALGRILLVPSDGAAVPGAPAPADAAGEGDPWRAYLDGLRAELAGNLPAAAKGFARALSGHGDACRAAGEYRATMRLLKRAEDPGALTVLRAENAGCVNLR